jgi:hypothetical protein
MSTFNWAALFLESSENRISSSEVSARAVCPPVCPLITVLYLSSSPHLFVSVHLFWLLLLFLFWCPCRGHVFLWPMSAVKPLNMHFRNLALETSTKTLRGIMVKIGESNRHFAWRPMFVSEIFSKAYICFWNIFEGLYLFLKYFRTQLAKCFSERKLFETWVSERNEAPIVCWMQFSGSSTDFEIVKKPSIASCLHWRNFGLISYNSVFEISAQIFRVNVGPTWCTFILEITVQIFRGTCTKTAVGVLFNSILEICNKIVR